MKTITVTHIVKDEGYILKKIVYTELAVISCVRGIEMSNPILTRIC
jgi:hypothetical protein